MKLEEYEQIMRTGTPSDRARAIAAANDDKELSEEEFHQLTALIKGAVRPSARKMTPDEAKLWAEVSRVKRRNRKYAVTFEERQPEVKRGEKGRMMSVYTCYNAAGDVIGEGTARELWEAGVFSNDNAAYYTYKEQGGRCIKRGIAKMTCRKEMRKVGQNNARGEKADCAAKKPERPVLRKIKDPTPLDYDVHDLILYNAIARKEGRPELTYGYWAAAGKPARP